MLQPVKELGKYSIGAKDGRIGHVTDFYFDDELWVIRYLVVDVSRWLPGRSVLISPLSIGKPERANRLFPVTISREQVRNSPPIDTAKPVSRQHEVAYLSYYAYPFYWGGSDFWGDRMALPGLASGGREAASLRAQAAITRVEAEAEEERLPDEDSHLRSCKVVGQYHVHASDGDIGHVEDFLIDPNSWAIRYLVVNTSDWWLGHQVLVGPEWIERVSWAAAKVTVSLNRQVIKGAPVYDSNRPLDRDDVAHIDSHYGHRPFGIQRASARDVKDVESLASERRTSR